MKQEIFTRDKLYKMVWAEPISKISPEYGITNYDLKKACRKMKIPLPTAGY